MPLFRPRPPVVQNSVYADRSTQAGDHTIVGNTGGRGAADCRRQPSWRGLRPNGRAVNDSRHHPADALSGGLDVPVTDVCVAQRHLHLGVAEQTRHHRQRNALHRCLAGKCMPEIVKAGHLRRPASAAAHPSQKPVIRPTARVRSSPNGRWKDPCAIPVAANRSRTWRAPRRTTASTCLAARSCYPRRSRAIAFHGNPAICRVSSSPFRHPVSSSSRIKSACALPEGCVSVHTGSEPHGRRGESRRGDRKRVSLGRGFLFRPRVG